MRSLLRMIPLVAAYAALAGACDRGPSCEEAAAGMLEIANDGVEGGEVADSEARERLRGTCEREAWPAATRRCLAEAPAREDPQEAATECMRRLAGEP
jgi:hypothetical protein